MSKEFTTFPGRLYVATMQQAGSLYAKDENNHQTLLESVNGPDQIGFQAITKVTVSSVDGTTILPRPRDSIISGGSGGSGGDGTTAPGGSGITAAQLQSALSAAVGGTTAVGNNLHVPGGMAVDDTITAASGVIVPTVTSANEATNVIDTCALSALWYGLSSVPMLAQRPTIVSGGQGTVSTSLDERKNESKASGVFTDSTQRSIVMCYWFTAHAFDGNTPSFLNVADITGARRIAISYNATYEYHHGASDDEYFVYPTRDRVLDVLVSGNSIRSTLLDGSNHKRYQWMTTFSHACKINKLYISNRPYFTVWALVSMDFSDKIVPLCRGVNVRNDTSLPTIFFLMDAQNSTVTCSPEWGLKYRGAPVSHLDQTLQALSTVYTGGTATTVQTINGEPWTIS